MYSRSSRHPPPSLSPRPPFPARLFAKRAARDSLDRTYRVSRAEGSKTQSGEVMGALSARANRDKRTFVLPIKSRALFNNFANAPARFHRAWEEMTYRDGIPP